MLQVPTSTYCCCGNDIHTIVVKSSFCALDLHCKALLAKSANTMAVDNYSNEPGRDDSLPVTAAIASWIAASNPSSLTEEMRNKLNELILDMIGITAAAARTSESSPAILKAITSLMGTTGGECTVLTQGSTFPPHTAALLNGTFGHSIDFDDTHTPSTLHPGVTAVWAAIAQAQVSKPSPDTFLMAVSVAYELTCRLGTELGYAAYSRGFHNTSTAGVFGAVAAIAVVKGLDASVVGNALGLAGSRAAGSMQYLDNGSHNKRLHPGFACHDAFVCVQLAEHGVIGATRIFEGKMGFLNAYSPSTKNLARLVDGLGNKWTFVETSLKPFPACRMTHGVIEMADIFSQKRRPKAMTPQELVDDVKSIEVRLSTSNMSLVGDKTPNKVHPKGEVDGQFSAYFQTAHSYLFGSNQGVKAYERLDDPYISALSDKISCVVDDDDEGVKGMGSRLVIKYQDGTTEDQTTRYPLGEPLHPFERSAIEKKFKSCMETVYGAEKSQEVLSLLNSLSQGKASITDIMLLLA